MAKAGGEEREEAMTIEELEKYRQKLDEMFGESSLPGKERLLCEIALDLKRLLLIQEDILAK